MSKQIAEQVITACEAFFDELGDAAINTGLGVALVKTRREVEELMDAAIKMRDEPQYWYFTTAMNRPRGYGYWKVKAANSGDARRKMFEAEQDKWAFQYDSLDQVRESDRYCHGTIL